MWLKIIKSKLCSKTTFKDFCTADDDVVVTLFLDHTEIVKEVYQNTTESLDSNTNEKNETFPSIFSL